MSRPVPCGAGRLRVACCPDRSPALLAAPPDLRRCLLPHGCSGRRVVCCRAGLLVVPVGGGPPASRPRRELRSARRLEARPGPAAAHGHRSQALRSLRCPSHQWGLVADVARCVVSKPGPAPPPPTGTAADPSGALHTSGAWSLMLLGALSRSPAGPYRRPSISRVIPLRLVQTLNLQRWNCNVLGWSGACCYKRRQSKVFFVWISAPLLQTSSIHRLFR